MNETTDFMKKQVSVRQLLKTQKVDITWMNFCVWSLTVCRELKCLLIWVFNWKKKNVTEILFQTQPSQFISGTASLSYQFQGQPSQSSALTQSDVHSIAVNDNIRFLSSILRYDKAFWIPCIIWLKNQRLLALDQSQVQADQSSDMNVISTVMTQKLGLQLHFLSDIRFAELMMWTADYRETLLHHWVYLNIDIEGIWRRIWCFIASEPSLSSSQSEHLSLLLSIPWLYSVNAVIRIHESRIEISDLSANEEVQKVVEPELIFSQDHNLLMYLKAILTQVTVQKDDSEDSEEKDSDSSVSLSESDDEKLTATATAKAKGKDKKSDFLWVLCKTLNCRKQWLQPFRPLPLPSRILLFSHRAYQNITWAPLLCTSVLCHFYPQLCQWLDICLLLYLSSSIMLVKAL